MNEKQPIVTYRKSRSPRAARVWETANLYTAMVQAAEIKQGIEKILGEEEVSISDMKPTLVPSEMLWFLMDSYLKAYSLLMKDGLIKSGNIHKISPTIN